MSVCAAIARQKKEIKLAASSSHIELKPGQPVQILIMLLRMPGRVATRAAVFKSLESRHCTQILLIYPVVWLTVGAPL